MTAAESGLFAGPNGDERTRPARGGLAGWQLRRVRALAAGDLRRLCPSDMAAAARLSPFHFSRAFKVSTGLPPARWLARARLERAAALLRDTRLTVGEIADQVGYGGASQFARAFRRETGCSPQAYRRL